MAHLLLFDVSSGNDFAVMEDAMALGHHVTFCTNDLSQYTNKGPVITDQLDKAKNLIEVPDFDEETLMRRLDEIHATDPFDALICVMDIRLVAAARAAKRFDLRFLSPEAALLSRNKTAVREKLSQRGISQPGFAQAASSSEVMEALAKTGYPAIIKPSDGYASESLFYLTGPESVDEVLNVLFSDEAVIDYGLGVYSNRLYSVEPYMKGQLIGVDIFSDGTSRLMLGINVKKMFPPPSFAIAGSCFPSNLFDQDAIRQYAFSVLDALEYNFGATHIEMIVNGDAFYIVEVNARLVGAQIPYQMAYAFERSIYVDLIDLHLGVAVQDMVPFDRSFFCVTRWIVVDHPGQIERLELPEIDNPHFRRVVLFKNVGDTVQPPITNTDRIGYVIAAGSTEAEATQLAEDFIANVHLRIGEEAS